MEEQEANIWEKNEVERGQLVQTSYRMTSIRVWTGDSLPRSGIKAGYRINQRFVCNQSFLMIFYISEDDFEVGRRQLWVLPSHFPPLDTAQQPLWKVSMSQNLAELQRVPKGGETERISLPTALGSILLILFSFGIYTCSL